MIVGYTVAGRHEVHGAQPGEAVDLSEVPEGQIKALLDGGFIVSSDAPLPVPKAPPETHVVAVSDAGTAS